MKSQFLLFAVVIAAVVFLYKRLIDTERRLSLAESERDSLQRERAAFEQSFTEDFESFKAFEKEHPLSNDPDKKMRKAMLDAIYTANAREALGDNFLDDEEDES